MNEVTASKKRLAQAVQDAAISSINEDIQEILDKLQNINDELPKLQSQGQTAFKQTIDASVNTLTQQIEATIGEKLKSLDETIANTERVSDDVVKQAALDFESTKLTFIQAIEKHIKERTEPIFKSIEKSQKEIDKAVKVSEMARQGFTGFDFFLVFFATFSSSLIALGGFLILLKLSLI